MAKNLVQQLASTAITRLRDILDGDIGAPVGVLKKYFTEQQDADAAEIAADMADEQAATEAYTTCPIDDAEWTWRITGERELVHHGRTWATLDRDVSRVTLMVDDLDRDIYLPDRIHALTGGDRLHEAMVWARRIARECWERLPVAEETIRPLVADGHALWAPDEMSCAAWEGGYLMIELAMPEGWVRRPAPARIRSLEAAIEWAVEVQRTYRPAPVLGAQAEGNQEPLAAK